MKKSNKSNKSNKLNESNKFIESNIDEWYYTDDRIKQIILLKKCMEEKKFTSKITKAKKTGYLKHNNLEKNYGKF